MKRLWIAVGLLLTLSSVALAGSRYLDHFASQMNLLLEQAEAQAEAGNWEQASELTEQALDIWDRHGSFLYTVLRHTDIDQVDTGFQEVLEFLQCQEDGEYSAANARLIAQVRLIAEMEQLTLRNLM